MEICKIISCRELCKEKKILVMHVKVFVNARTNGIELICTQETYTQKCIFK